MSAATVCQLLVQRACGVEDVPGEPIQEFLLRMAALLSPRVRVLLEPGMRLRTVSGRIVTFPRFKGAVSTLPRQMYAWLRDEAIVECEATGNDLAASIVRGINPRHVSSSDSDTLNDILFGSELGATLAHVVLPEEAHASV